MPFSKSKHVADINVRFTHEQSLVFDAVIVLFVNRDNTTGSITSKMVYSVQTGSGTFPGSLFNGFPEPFPRRYSG
jgi:hypothetical protein